MTTATLLEIINNPAYKQADVAAAFALILRGDDIDWPVVSQAIKTRWSIAGHMRIKELAWKLNRGCLNEPT